MTVTGTPNEELWEVQWRPRPSTSFKPVYLSRQQRESAGLNSRGQTASQANAVAASAVGDASAALSIIQQQHPVDRLATAAMKGTSKVTNGAYVPPHLRAGGGAVSGAPKPPVLLGANTATTPKVKLSEQEKKIRSLQKVDIINLHLKKRNLFVQKLDQIDKLKVRHAAGDKLEANQIEKITSYDSLVAELRALELA
jgi:uncharacterized protein with WD repeat